jgi:hypothetical protein
VLEVLKVLDVLEEQPEWLRALSSAAIFRPGNLEHIEHL